MGRIKINKYLKDFDRYNVTLNINKNNKVLNPIPISLIPVSMSKSNKLL